MWKDPIVEETRSRREELARRFSYDIKAIGEELRRRQKASGQKPLTRPPKRVKATAAQQDASADDQPDSRLIRG